MRVLFLLFMLSLWSCSDQQPTEKKSSPIYPDPNQHACESDWIHLFSELELEHPFPVHGERITLIRSQFGGRLYTLQLDNDGTIRYKQYGNSQEPIHKVVIEDPCSGDIRATGFDKEIVLKNEFGLWNFVHSQLEDTPLRIAPPINECLVVCGPDIDVFVSSKSRADKILENYCYTQNSVMELIYHKLLSRIQEASNSPSISF